VFYCTVSHMLLGIVVFDTCHLCNCRIFTQLTWCIFVTYGPIIIWRLDSATSQNTLLCCFVDMFVWHAVYYDCLKSTRLWTTVNYSCFIVPRHCFLGSLCLSIQGGPRKRGHRLMTIILSNLNRLKKISLSDSLVNLQLNGYLKSRCNLHMLLHYLVNL